MRGRDKATKHMGNARIDRAEARWYTDGSARTSKAQAKREMRKARRALGVAEIAEQRDPSRSQPVGITADATGTPGTEARTRNQHLSDTTTETIR